MKILLASGDHHTCGSNPISKVTFNGDKVWAKYLSDSLNYKYLNIAKPGAGTEEVAMNTIMCAHNLIEKHKEDPANIFVVVLWGVNNKKHLYWTGDEHRSYGIGSTMEVSNDVKQFVEHKTKLDSGGYDVYKDFYNIYTTAIALERYNIKYQFLNTSTLRKPIDKKVLEVFNVVSGLYGNRAEKHLGLYNDVESFDSYVKERATPLASGANSYPYWGEDAHKIYSNYVLSKVNANAWN